MDGDTGQAVIYRFEGFCLDPVGRHLTHEDSPVKLSGRLFDTLLYLVVNSPAWVAKSQMIEGVWLGRVGNAGNVSKAISSLRAALIAHGAPGSLIVTASGRGYRLAAPVTVEPACPLPACSSNDALPAANLPAYPQIGQRGIACWGCAAAILVGALAAWRGVPHGADTARPEPRFLPPARALAVLPFATIGGDPGDHHLADGISEEIVTALGGVQGLRVVAGQASAAPKEGLVPALQIARQLNVGSLLEGAVHVHDGRIGITARLVDALSGRAVWAQAYDRDTGNVLTVESEIAAAVVGSLKAVMLPDQAGQITVGGTTNGDALDAFLTALDREDSPDPAVSAGALGEFDRAVSLDPAFADAVAARSFLLYRLGMQRSDHRMIAQSVEDAEQAIRLAPDLAEAHAAWAFGAGGDRLDFVRASVEVHRALALSPGNTDTLRAAVKVLWATGHLQDAIDASLREVSIDPLSPTAHRTLARSLAMAGRFAEARAVVEHAASIKPDEVLVNGELLGLIAIYQGDAPAAVALCRSRTDLFGSFCLAWAYHALGRQAEAEAWLARLRAAADDGGAYRYAEIYAAWGDRERAVMWLKRAYDLRDPGLAMMRIDPMLVPIRGLPAYREIETDLGGPP